jgi:hypothetical protein
VLAWVEDQAQGHVWPSGARQRAVEAGPRAVEAEQVPVLEAPMSRVLLSGERTAEKVWPR